MGRRLACAVAVHTETGAVWCASGSSPSPDVAALIRNPDVWADAAPAREERVELTNAAEGLEPPRSGRGSSRNAWAVYAAGVGVDVTDEMDRDAIIAAVDEAVGR